MDQNGEFCQVLNDAGVLVSWDIALADQIATDYFPNCGGAFFGRGLASATKEEVAQLLDICRQETVGKDSNDFIDAVNIIKRCFEQELDCDILAVLVKEGRFVASEPEKHQNVVVRIIARICFMCAAGHYMG